MSSYCISKRSDTPIFLFHEGKMRWLIPVQVVLAEV